MGYEVVTDNVVPATCRKHLISKFLWVVKHLDIATLLFDGFSYLRVDCSIWCVKEEMLVPFGLIAESVGHSARGERDQRGRFIPPLLNTIGM